MALDSLGAAESDVRRREVARLVQVVLDRLPSRYGDALEWKYIDGLTVVEIAGRLGVAPKAAESVLTREMAAAGERLIATRDRVTWIAPPIRLEGMRLEEVVALAARAKGLTPEWRSPASTRGTVLHGDVAFTPDEALDAATAAAGVRWRVQGQQLIIEVKP